MNIFKMSLLINGLGTIIVGLIQFYITKVVAVSLGAEILGLTKLYTQLISYIALFDMGVMTAITYALYRPLKYNDLDEIRSVIFTLNYVLKVFFCAIFTVSVILSFVMLYTLDTAISNQRLLLYWYILVLNFSIGYISNRYIVVFSADHKFYIVKLVQIFSLCIMYIFQIVSLSLFHSLDAYFASTLVSGLLTLSIMYYLYNKHYPTYSSSGGKKIVSIFSNMKKLFFHKLAGLVVYSTDYLIISIFLGMTYVAYYSSYLMVYSLILLIIGILRPILNPYIGSKFVDSSSESKLYDWRELFSLYTFLGIVAALGFYYLVNSFILVWLGREYIISNTAVLLFSLNLFIAVIRQATDTIKENSGYFKDIYNPILEAAINLIISILLVSKFGLEGVLFGTLCSNIIVVMLTKPLVVFKDVLSSSFLIYIFSLNKTIITILISGLLIEIIVSPSLSSNLVVFCVNIILIFSIVFLVDILIDGNFRLLIKKVAKF